MRTCVNNVRAVSAIGPPSCNTDKTPSPLMYFLQSARDGTGLMLRNTSSSAPSGRSFSLLVAADIVVREAGCADGDVERKCCQGAARQDMSIL